MKRIALTVLLSLSSLAQADRYYTWIDETGTVRHTLIREENPILKRAEQVRKQAGQQESSYGQPGHKSQSVGGMRLPAGAISDSQLAEIAEEPDAGSAVSEAGRGQETAHSQTRGPQGKEAGQESLSSERLGAGGGPESSDVVYSTDDYIDAGELARRGYIREGQEPRFYTWVDQNGIIHNSPYPPADESGAEDVLPEPETPVSPFLVEERAELASVASLVEVDDFARRLFKLDQKPQGRIQQFSDACCSALPIGDVGALDPDDGYTIEFDEEHDSFTFATGSSPFEVIRLPVSQRSYRLQIRSFINNQLFFPSLVFLDEELKPQRILSNVIYEYEPENWFRYGYLQGWVDVEAHRGERYLLVLSTEEDLKKQTTVQRRQRQVQYRHGQLGLIYLSVVRPQ